MAYDQAARDRWITPTPRPISSAAAVSSAMIRGMGRPPAARSVHAASPRPTASEKPPAIRASTAQSFPGSVVSQGGRGAGGGEDVQRAGAALLIAAGGLDVEEADDLGEPARRDVGDEARDRGDDEVEAQPGAPRGLDLGRALH